MTPDERRQLLRRAFDAGVAAAHPAVCIPAHLPAPPKGRVIVLAAGKGGGACAEIAEKVYREQYGLGPDRLIGLAVTRHGHARPTEWIKVIEAGHPVPDAAGLQGAADTLALAEQAGPDDLVVALITGGGSANWVAPAAGLDLAVKQGTTKALLRSGAPIDAINTVRKHLSRIKGGRLARAAYPAKVVTLAISDVPRDDPSVIASGPTVPDASTLADARAALERYKVTPHPDVARALSDPANESPKPGDPAFEHASFTVVSRPADALAAAIKTLEDAGVEVRVVGADLEGEAREVAAEHAAIARGLEALARPVALISGGELTVTIRGQNGRGGPNQEYALALAHALRGVSGWSALAGDTDGADGGGGSPEDPAGAVVDPGTLERADAKGLDTAHFLAENDSTGFFEQTGDGLYTGPTCTNVNDLRILLVDSV
ncbi:hydroxypyruvate reductase [Methylopila capsulata]|uniref:Hydroxypyruvate reductase n=1 Tax=Methylopila capsulata TaxID=61654 RepID=A0A9W6IXD4_9HYPH|nr:glycerate kinase [Methylopila capsulata]MBM7853467.1 hydroxypyruvate reductase [Methylopila capsulata]GLK57319.1 hydroxypyruvate reductase [Methylopila capsulata]